MDEAKRNGHAIEDGVSKWWTLADGFIQDASKFLEDEKAAPKRCLNGLMCPNLKSRYQLSRADMQERRQGMLIKSMEMATLRRYHIVPLCHREILHLP